MHRQCAVPGLRNAAIALALALASVCAADAAEPASAWDTTKPRGKTRSIDFMTGEGTWMSVDPSPDGRFVVFDLLGHIYRVPMTGGAAQCLTQDSGIAVNFQPRYSPDGKTIAFVSDRKGQYNLWLMDSDGSNPRPVGIDNSVCISEPAWTPDGRFLVVRRQTGQCSRSNDTVALWLYDRSGGEGRELVAGNRAGGKFPGSPSLSPDSRQLYFHVNVCSGNLDDVVQGCFQLRRIDLRTGRVEEVTTGRTSLWSRDSSGGPMAPQISPDGTWLAFARRIPDGTVSFKGHRFGPRTALWLRNMKTGEERIAMDPIEVDMAENTYYATQILPAYGWSKDSRSIVLSQGGHLRVLEIPGGRVRTIPFEASVKRTISERIYPTRRISDGPVEIRFLRWPTGSPDGRTLAFQAAGRIWLQGLPGRDAPPRRLTPSSFEPFELSPAWSPDGRFIAFTTWDERARGHLWKIAAAGGEPVRLTLEAGEYLHPVWSPDGRSIVLARGSLAAVRSRSWSHQTWYDLVRIPAAGGEAEPLVDVPAAGEWRQIVRPSVGPEGRIFYPEPAEPKSPDEEWPTGLISVRPDGSDRRAHLLFPYADEIVVSPDGGRVAFQEGNNVYLMAFPWMGEAGPPSRVDRLKAQYVVQPLSTEGGLFPRWRDARTLEFGSGTRYFVHHADSGKTDVFDIHLSLPRALPKGSIALTGARIVTLDKRRVIDDGTILVKAGRIACVGRCDTSVASRVIDVRGKTIIPGFIDLHVHNSFAHQGVEPKSDFERAAYLAYGVTTTLDPSVWSQSAFPVAEMIETGEVLGPRSFSTGDTLYGADGPSQNELTSYESAVHNVNRTVAWGAVSIKQYLQPRREQRQWIVEAARGKGVLVTAEFGDLEYNLSMIMDGQAGWEHDLMYLPIYGDVAKFLGKAEAIYSPTFTVTGSGMVQEEFFFQEKEVWKDPKLRRWLPWTRLVPQTRRRMLRPVSDYCFPLIAQGAADIIAEGGTTVIGSHGQLHGIGSHWEVRIAASAMGPMQALEVASLHGARGLGAEQDLGSIAVGKLADLMVLNSNPLDDIRNTQDIRYVMKAGFLYDGFTLDEIWPERRPFGEPYWVDPDSLRDDDRPVDWWDRPAHP